MTAHRCPVCKGPCTCNVWYAVTGDIRKMCVHCAYVPVQDLSDRMCKALDVAERNATKAQFHVAARETAMLMARCKAKRGLGRV